MPKTASSEPVGHTQESHSPKTRDSNQSLASVHMAGLEARRWRRASNEDLACVAGAGQRLPTRLCTSAEGTAYAPSPPAWLRLDTLGTAPAQKPTMMSPRSTSSAHPRIHPHCTALEQTHSAAQRRPWSLTHSMRPPSPPSLPIPRRAPLLIS